MRPAPLTPTFLFQTEIRDEKLARRSSAAPPLPTPPSDETTIFSVERATIDRMCPCGSDRACQCQCPCQCQCQCSSEDDSSSPSDSSSPPPPSQDYEESDLLREVYMPPPITPPMINDEKSEKEEMWTDRTSAWVSATQQQVQQPEKDWQQSESGKNWQQSESDKSWQQPEKDYYGNWSSSSSTVLYPSGSYYPSSSDQMVGGGSEASSSQQHSTAFSSIQQVYNSDKSDKHYSCGQSSLFGELQSVVFNSLIASLET